MDQRRSHRPFTAVASALILGGALAAVALLAAPALAQAPDQIDLPDGWQPEGITSDETKIWVGSLAEGGVWRADVRTGEGEIVVQPKAGAVAVGLDIEPVAHRLWVAGGPTGEVRVFDSRSGSPIKTYHFDAGFLNDIVVTPGGAFATDSERQQLAFIPIGPTGGLPGGDGGVSELSLTGDIVYEDGVINTNGIVAVRGWLIIVQSSTGSLFRVDPASGTAFRIDTEGIDLRNGDGLTTLGEILYVVRNQDARIMVLELSPLLDSAELLGELTAPSFETPTTATVADDQLFVVDARFGVQGAATVPYWVARLPLRP
jgi:sugar lactone lactonase YvrE